MTERELRSLLAAYQRGDLSLGILLDAMEESGNYLKAWVQYRQKEWVFADLDRGDIVFPATAWAKRIPDGSWDFWVYRGYSYHLLGNAPSADLAKQYAAEQWIEYMRQGLLSYR